VRPALALAALLAMDAGAQGDVARGLAIVAARETNCVLCHEVPGVAGPMGNVGPPLAGVGARLSQAELRMRIVDSTRVNPATVMPSYHRVEGLHRVPPELRGKPVLSAQQVEDVVAYLGALK
jgi:L-cysteine S-thiosulfotransferase